MFALEIDFHDGISSPETILVRRSNALVGTSEQAHVVVEGAPSGTPEIRLIRGLGMEFRCELSRRSGQLNRAVAVLEGTYRRSAELKVGEVTLRVTALDLDLALLPDETPDRAAVRVLRSALSRPSPFFPALAIVGPNPVFLSFPADQPLLVGRSRRCGMRLESVDVSAEHARFGVEAGKLWVEDLGSTNGTFVNGEQISGRRFLERDDRIAIGSGYIVAPILGPDDVAAANRASNGSLTAPREDEEGYPCLISLTELVRPSRFVLHGQGTARIGRDPASDIWINAPHISRQHLVVRWSYNGEVEFVDTSSNGTYLWGERLPKGEAVRSPEGFVMLDFCSGITVALCFSLDDEANFVNRRSGQSAGEDFEGQADPPDWSAEAGSSRGAMTLSGVSRSQVASSAYDQDSDYRLISSKIDGVPDNRIEDWGSVATTLGDQNKKGPSVFEQLVQRNRNQAHGVGESASEGEQTSREGPVDREAMETAFGLVLPEGVEGLFRRDSGAQEVHGGVGQNTGAGRSDRGEPVSGFGSDASSAAWGSSSSESTRVFGDELRREHSGSDPGFDPFERPAGPGIASATPKLGDDPLGASPFGAKERATSFPGFEPGEFLSGSQPAYQPNGENAALSGILDVDTPLGRGEPGMHPRGGEDMFGGSAYDEEEIEPSSERRILRVLLVVCVAILFGFCILLLLGLFSDRYFY